MPPAAQAVRAGRGTRSTRKPRATSAGASRAFATPAALRAWFRKHHGDTSELVVGCFKVHAAGQGVTYRQALDEALCFGWIDGVRHGLDDDSFTVRFTPRRPKSYWSAVNLRRVRELEAAGRLAAPGRARLEKHEPRPKRYSFENRPVELDLASRKQLEANRRAWRFFSAQAPWFRRTSQFWVMSAKREETRAKRLGTLIACSAALKPIPPLAGVRVRMPDEPRSRR